MVNNFTQLNVNLSLLVLVNYTSATIFWLLPYSFQTYYAKQLSHNTDATHQHHKSYTLKLGTPTVTRVPNTFQSADCMITLWRSQVYTLQGYTNHLCSQCLKGQEQDEV